MSYAIVYQSKTGNTAQLAQALREALPPQGCVYFGAPHARAAAADTLYIGFWTDKGQCDDVLASFLQTLHGKRVLLFGTAGFGGSQAYFTQILNRVRALLPTDCTAENGWMCQGKMPQAIRERWAELQLQKPSDPTIPPMLENFDRALTHPDADDIAALEAWAHSTLQ